MQESTTLNHDPIRPALGLEEALGIDPQVALWEGDISLQTRRESPWRAVGLLSVWEAQSQLSTIVLISLTAVLPVWLAIVPMLAWSLVATVAYHLARQRGLPDVLDSAGVLARRGRGVLGLLKAGCLTAGRAWLAGFQAFLYTRTARGLLNSPARCSSRRLTRAGVVGLGLTLFGVSTTHHLLQKAGFSGGALLRLGFVGSLLNVTYRVLLSALVLDLARALATHAKG
jgi:hypothetical protein